MICRIPQSDHPQTYHRRRSCTDLFFSLIFMLYWAGLIVIASICFSYGNPLDLWYGTDYLGYNCGQGVSPTNFQSYIQENAFQSKNWTENTLLWVPLTVDHRFRQDSGVSASEMIFLYGARNIGICVQKCPHLVRDSELSSVAPISHSYLYSYGEKLRNGTKLGYPIPRTFDVYYNSTAVYGRCVPSSFRYTSRPQQSFTENFIEQFLSGTIEVFRCWRVIVSAILLSVVLCILYIYFLRHFTKAMVYTSIGATVIGICVAGWVLYEWSTLGNHESESSSILYCRIYFAFAIVSWGCALIGCVVFYWFQRNIDEASALIQSAGNMVASNWQLVCVPILSFTSFCALFVFFASVAVLAFSVEEKYLRSAACKHIQFMASTAGYDDFNWDTVNLSIIKWLAIYLLFGFCWTIEILSAYCFMILSFCTVFWYFSQRCDKESTMRGAYKFLPLGSLRRAVVWTTFYHFGSLVVGSFLVAIVQMLQIFVRVVNYQASRVLQKNDVNRFLFYISDAIVTACKKLLDIATKNSYVFICITSRCFCIASRESFNLLNKRFVTLVFLQFMKELMFLIGKVFVTIVTLLCSMILINSPSFVSPDAVHFYPLIVIAISSFVISCNFFHLFSVTVQAMLLCFAYDSHYNDGLYAPEELKKFLR